MGGQGMPFVTSKGPLLNLLDARYSAAGANVEERIGILDRLKQGWTPGQTMGGTIDAIDNAVDLNGDPVSPEMLEDFFFGRSVSTSVPVALRKHLNRHWFGLETDDDGHALSRDQDPTATSTGWWSNWKGDAEAVFREGLIRALEVSLGVKHESAGFGPGYVPQQALPIDFTWTCGAPRFEVYVRWRRVGGSGMVMVNFITPAATDLPLTTSFDGLEGVVFDGEIDTKILTQDVGMLVIGQDTTISEPSPGLWEVDAHGAPRVAALEFRASGVAGSNRPGIEWIPDPDPGGGRTGGVARLPIEPGPPPSAP